MSYGYASLTDALAEMAAQVRANNIAHGWRNPDGTPDKTFGEYVALLHSEVSEALEAFRDHGLKDMTDAQECFEAGPEMCATHSRHMSWCKQPPKPEGVGSELADVLIRLLDMADAFGVDLGAEYHRKMTYNQTRAFRHGGKVL